ncbi:hypothetical protein ABZ307_30930 [Streptomyces griseorubiginosus]|uniref:hypothetical protein n=1 Tax=Streptomyces griseorubiginosus TaxID=67304 RepID=UPI0033BA6A87
MREKRRSLLGLLGALMLALAAAFAAAPAQAAAPPDRDLGHTVILPKPAGGVSTRSVAAVPGISPSTNVSYGVPGQSITCPSGNLCAGAWDTSRNQWKIFYLYSCKRYALTNWLDWGWFDNAQTGGAIGYFYGQNGNVLRTVYPGGGIQSYYWDAVWSIRNC